MGMAALRSLTVRRSIVVAHFSISFFELQSECTCWSGGGFCVIQPPSLLRDALSYPFDISKAHTIPSSAFRGPPFVLQEFPW